MAETAAHLLDQVSPPLPVRQWVLVLGHVDAHEVILGVEQELGQRPAKLGLATAALQQGQVSRGQVSMDPISS
jgi:hypothetical protein